MYGHIVFLINFSINPNEYPFKMYKKAKNRQKDEINFVNIRQEKKKSEKLALDA